MERKRKRLEGMLLVRVAQEDRAWLEQVSDKDDRSVSYYVRKLIRRGREGTYEELLEACRKVLELAKATEFMEHPTMEFVAAAIKRAEGK